MIHRRLSATEKAYLKENLNAVVCNETGELFKNPNQAAESMGYSYQQIRDQVMHIRRNPINGHTFDYLERVKGRRF